MKAKAPALLFGLLLATPAMAYQWIQYADYPLPYFYDKKSIKKLKNGLYTVKSVEHNTRYPTSRVYTFTFDCKRKKYKVGPSIFYSKHKGAGKIKSKDSWTSSMSSFTADEKHQKALFKIVCQK